MLYRAYIAYPLLRKAFSETCLILLSDWGSGDTFEQIPNPFSACRVVTHRRTEIAQNNMAPVFWN
jgi:hypothetical protein